jgi:hypothetical protein
VKFYMEIDHKHSYKLCEILFISQTIANMVTVQNFEILTNKFK